MTRWVIAAALMVCAVGLAWAGPGDVEGKSATASDMYLEETVVGTILAAEKMYAAEGVEWHSCELRVDAVEGTSGGVKPGEVLRVQYPVESKLRPTQKPGAGSQVRAAMKAPRKAEPRVWTAGALETLGRGELVRPGEGADEDLGPADAKVLVKMLAPLGPECHQKTAGLLRDLAEREPERLRVQLFDMARPEVRSEMLRERLTCATVLVNNRFEFTLEGDGGTRKLVLSRKPNDPRSTYNSEDVIAVAEQEIARAYSVLGTGNEEKSAP